MIALSDDVALIEAEAEPDRDSWTTPEWIAAAVGPVDLDPCSNERSRIRAAKTFDLERGQDGLVLARFVSRRTRTWINPPYSRGQVIRWVRAYGHTRFSFLVRFDTSTEWFAELEPRTGLVLVTKDRVEFDPPPGVARVPGSPFPHVLMFARAEDATPAIRALCYEWVPRRAIG